MDEFIDHFVGGIQTSKFVVMPKKAYVAEHKHLISLLSRYKDPVLQAEADKQSAELQEELKGSGEGTDVVLRVVRPGGKPHYYDPTHNYIWVKAPGNKLGAFVGKYDPATRKTTPCDAPRVEEL
jgi:hypothetical protein